MFRSLEIILISLGVCIGAAGVAKCSAEQRAFHGRLDDKLQIDTRGGSLLFLKAAPGTLARVLKLDDGSLSTLYQGEVNLGSKPEFRFGVAIAELKDRSKVLFINRRSGKGALLRPDKMPFTTASQPYYAAEVDFQVPLREGAFQSVPVFIALPKSTEGYSVKPGEYVAIIGDRPFIGGVVRLPDSSLIVRYAYDIDSASVDLVKATEWFDVDGNGKIDIGPGSPEIGVPKNAAPVFNVGNMALQTASISLAAHSFVLTQVPMDPMRIGLRVGGQMPDFAYRDFSGQSHKLSEIKARYILLDFWATWCVPCVADLPSKLAAYQHFHEKGFEILGMDGDVDKDKPEALLKKMGARWPEAKPDHELLQERFQISIWPTLILIDQTGKIISTSQFDQYPLSGADLQKTLEKLLR